MHFGVCPCLRVRLFCERSDPDERCNSSLVKFISLGGTLRRLFAHPVLFFSPPHLPTVSRWVLLCISLSISEFPLVSYYQARSII
jgi:hypothetical protein